MSFPDAVVADAKVGLRCLVPLHEGLCTTIAEPDQTGVPGIPAYSDLPVVPLSPATGRLLLNSGLVAQTADVGLSPVIRLMAFGFNVSGLKHVWNDVYTKPGEPNWVDARESFLIDGEDGSVWYCETAPNPPTSGGWIGPFASDITFWSGARGELSNLIAWAATGEVAEFFTGGVPATPPGTTNLTQYPTLSTGVSPFGKLVVQAVATRAYNAPDAPLRLAGVVAQDCEVRVRHVGSGFGMTSWDEATEVKPWELGVSYGPPSYEGAWHSFDSEAARTPHVRVVGSAGDVLVHRSMASPTRTGGGVWLRPSSAPAPLLTTWDPPNPDFRLGRQGMSAQVRLRLNGRRERLSCLLYAVPNPREDEPSPALFAVETDPSGALYGAAAEAVGFLRDGEWSLEVWEGEGWAPAPLATRTAVIEYRGALVAVLESDYVNNPGLFGSRANYKDLPGHNINDAGAIEVRDSWTGDTGWVQFSDITGLNMFAGRLGSTLAVIDSGAEVADITAAYGIEVVAPA